MEFSEFTHGSKKSEYLVVDKFMQDFLQSKALAAAFEMHLIDYLIVEGKSDFYSLSTQLKIDRQGLQLLLQLLLANKVVEEKDDEISLSEQFLDALPYRDLLEIKLEFAELALRDLFVLFPIFIKSPSDFFDRAHIFKLFNYAKCFKKTESNYQQTKHWMRLTTILTRYESHICLENHDFSLHRRLLDVGGNSGEFALQICKFYGEIQATVFDLPLVCQIGRQHTKKNHGAARISFVEGNILEDILPKGADIITFKSMLHDWPEGTVKFIIRKAADALENGGTLLIFERGKFDTHQKIPYSLLPFLAFYHAFRSPDLYIHILKDLDFTAISVRWFELEMPFFLITAKKIIATNKFSC